MAPARLPRASVHRAGQTVISWGERADHAAMIVDPLRHVRMMIAEDLPVPPALLQELESELPPHKVGQLLGADREIIHAQQETTGRRSPNEAAARRLPSSTQPLQVRGSADESATG